MNNAIERAARKTATILGPSSASHEALLELERQRSLGRLAYLILDNKTLLVVSEKAEA